MIRSLFSGNFSLIDLILSGEISDSKTIAAILAYKEKYINRGDR